MNEPDMESLAGRSLLVFDPMAECEGCGCNNYQACPGGCAWSDYYLDRDRWVCTTCEPLLLCIEMSARSMALRIDGFLASAPAARERGDA